MNRRNITIGIIAFVVLGAAYLGLSGGDLLGVKPTPTPAASLDDLENLVTASGMLVPVKRADLSLKVAGQAQKVAIKPGDVVKQGDTLVVLDAADLKASVSMAQAQLAELRAGATKEDIAVAQANLESARAQLAKVRAGATAEDVAIAKAGIDRATSALKDATSQYDRVKDDPFVGMYPESAALEQATQEYTIAQARYTQVAKGASVEDIRVAESAVAVAQANLDRVNAGARPEQVAAAQARLDQAQAGLAAATLTAPFDGTVAVVNLKEGEMVSPGVPVVTLGDLSNLRLETDDLSETNIARIKFAMPVEVTFEALPGKTFDGKVTYIAPISSQKQGGTNYTLYIELANLDPVLRWGMTGHIEINTR